jgi:hypothetical protein
MGALSDLVHRDRVFEGEQPQRTLGVRVVVDRRLMGDQVGRVGRPQLAGAQLEDTELADQVRRDLRG